MGSDEMELAAVMRTSASGLIPPAGLVSGGIARGRRMKLVRRVQVGVSTAAVLAVAGTTLFVASDRTDGGPGEVAGPAGPTAVVSTPPTTPLAPKTRPTLPVPSGMAPVLPPLLLHSLLPLLPGGLVPTQITGVDHSDMTATGVYSAGATVSLVLEDSAGPTLISVSVQQTAERADEAGCPHQEGSTNAACSDYRTPDGSRVVERQDWVYPAAPDTPENRADGKAGPSGRGPKDWSVRVVRRDGVVVTIDEIASREEKGDIGRDTPLLPMERLRSMAIAPVWQVWVTVNANETAAKTPPTVNYQSSFRPQKYDLPTSTAVPSTATPRGAGPENGTGSIPRTEVPSRSIPESGPES
ncbi:hypothetical protein [Embleya scabrispora]|uniref:hypothetical protein n=1 Tax=Embleya scabrispora TaxID=159449 RepID=UPI0003AAA300|nr:hypothetical protein [Embleya scabrispora]MYS85873.1 hypothetical protein [Streptomyces sp. SID5474]